MFLHEIFSHTFASSILWFWGAATKDTANGARGLGFDFQTGQMGHSVANVLPLLPRFFEAVSLRR